MRSSRLLAGLLLLALPGIAVAQDTYTVHHCQAPSGGVATTDGLSAVSGYAGLSYACPGQGVASGPPTAEFALLQGFGIRYRVPADTRLASYVLYRTVGVPAPWSYTGRLLGGHVPARGKAVEVQAFERGRWRTFDSVRASRRGRFIARYRFSASSIGRTFRMRARIRPEATYPFALGHSPVVLVRVR